VEVRAAEWSNTLEHKPFCLLVDREHCEVIVAIRGTLSVTDIATDAMAHPHPLPPGVEGAAADHGKAAAHGGVCKAAMALERTLVGSGVLGRLLLGDTSSCKGFALIITGHSLGAGVAAVLALLIRDTWRAHQVVIAC
jgi:sn1-specific diacylglycerol lipase